MQPIIAIWFCLRSFADLGQTVDAQRPSRTMERDMERRTEERKRKSRSRKLTQTPRRTVMKDAHVGIEWKASTQKLVRNRNQYSSSRSVGRIDSVCSFSGVL